jgi:hypothetical protein
LGIDHVAEPKVSPGTTSRKAVDIELYNVYCCAGKKKTLGTVGLDVTTVNPLAPSYANVAHEPGFAAKKAAKDKFDHYKEYIHTFFPFVVESTGSFLEPYASDVLDVFKRYAEHRGVAFSLFHAKASLALEHRKALLNAVHAARSTIMASSGSQRGFDPDDIVHCA